MTEVVSPNAATATSDDPIAFKIGIPVEATNPGTIRKPPPIPKNPENAPVKAPKPSTKTRHASANALGLRCMVNTVCKRVGVDMTGRGQAF